MTVPLRDDAELCLAGRPQLKFGMEIDVYNDSEMFQIDKSSVFCGAYALSREPPKRANFLFSGAINFLLTD